MPENIRYVQVISYAVVGAGSNAPGLVQCKPEERRCTWDALAALETGAGR